MQYAARIRDERILMDSASGGAFSGVAQPILDRGGVVFGAAWDGLRSVHVGVDQRDGLNALRGSKYTVSDMTGVYAQIRQVLSEGREVLFTGTPCQTAAVYKFFGEQPNLTFCSLICMSNADPAIWRQYVEDLEREKKSKLVSVNFRDKTDGWSRSRISLVFDDGEASFSENLYENAYWRAFSIAPRTACMSCPFRSGANGADLIIGDFWGVENVLPEWNDGKGVSAVLVYTDKGAKLVGESGLRLVHVQYEQILARNKNLEQQYSVNLRIRSKFLSEYRKYGIEEAVRRATHRSLALRVCGKVKKMAKCFASRMRFMV